MAAGGLWPCYLLPIYPLEPWRQVGGQWGQDVGDIFQLYTPPPLVSSPGEAYCLSSPCPWALALGTSKIPLLSEG